MMLGTTNIKFITMFITSHHPFLPFLRSILKLSSHTCLYSKWFLPSGFSFPPHMCRRTRPPIRAAWSAHLILSNLITWHYSVQKEKVRRFKCGELASHVIKYLLLTERPGNPSLCDSWIELLDADVIYLGENVSTLFAQMLKGKCLCVEWSLRQPR